MSASEFAFLALGLVFGVAVGAALFEVLRSRPPAPREIRLTVAPDSIPRRPAATLSASAFVTEPAQPARGGPADRRGLDRIGDHDAPANDPPPVPALAPARASIAGRPVAVTIHSEPDPALAALRRLAAATAERAMVHAGLSAATMTPALALGSAAGGAVALAAATRTGGEHGPGGDEHAAAIAPPPAVDGGPCSALRRAAEERCAHALRAREQAEVARDALRAAQRAYDDHLTRSDRAAADADPRAVRGLKEAAQHTFRAARAAARTAEEVESAARDWLTEINRINVAARDAAGALERERSQANGLVMEIERLTVEADAARISAESADEVCLRARQAVADCEEAQAQPPAVTAAAAPSPEVVDPPQAAAAGAMIDDDERAIVLAPGAPEPAILRLLRGDRGTLQAVVASLAGDDPDERRRWQRSLMDLVDAILARAIEAAALDFPPDHPFWGPFTRDQNRDIVAALASLGYRYDGLGGWLDDRIPGQRDLSLAVGYAGLDPMRIRHWPNEAEMRELFRGVTVAADEYLAAAAGGMSLGELVSLLGLRADGLTDLWNEWGRLRPLLLSAG